jgi:multiple sugar transport system substrate-binding protein
MASVALAGCSSNEESNTGAQSIVVWSLENQTDRVQATQKIADAFAAKTGIKVKIVGVDENQFSQLATAAAAAGTLPDVIGALSLAGVRELATNKLIDTKATQQVIDGLGGATFSARALELTKDSNGALGVPSDGWPQVLVYRKDLFDKAGLAPPDTFDAIRAAAQKLNSKDMAGIVMATVPNDAFTAQTFENFALANNCQMVDNSGAVTLNSPQCVQTFQFYNDMVRNYSVRGAQDVDSTRATYFSGKAGMLVWSSFILDEMAGLRNDALPTCPECKSDPAYLAKNSGIVTAIKGPGGSEPAQFGELTSWTITESAKTDPAKKFVEYMMGDGYLGWLGIAPEGKFPTRKGTADDATKFSKGWDTLAAGVDTKKPLGEIYPADVVQALRTCTDNFQRWGITQGQGALVGATLGELPVPKAISAMTSGKLTPAAAAEQASDAVESIKSTIK